MKVKKFAKRLLKKVFKDQTYVSAHPMIKGLKVTGDLGFLYSPSLSAEDEFLLDLHFQKHFENKVVYDVGAHIGLMTLFFATVAKEVISFEPNPLSYQYLHRNVVNNGLDNVKLINAGLGEKTEKAMLIFEEGNNAVGSFSSQKKLRAESQEVEAYLVALDDLNLPPPDFIKIDVEGYEAEAIKGMQKTLQKHKPDLLIELHGDMHFVINLLSNYKVHVIKPKKFIYCQAI